MSKKLLIHNDNIVDMNLFHKEIKFVVNAGNLDEKISQNLKNINTINLDIIYIKDNLSSNYLELYGLRVAYHIRLSEGINQYTPIVILSDVDSHILNKLDPMARILFTKNVFIIKNNKKDFTLPKNFSELTKDNYKDKFLNLITIDAPENSTSHSITNEWAIERWATLLGIEDNETIITNRKKIASMLYFKYLKQKYILNTVKIPIKKNEKIEGKLLFIDDRGSDGWNDIIENYVYKHSNIEFKALKSEYKDITTIQKSLKEVIEDYKPNIILLDLRLIQNESDIISHISGIKILEHIKKLNPSIQVIMFTASNDSSIIDTLYSKGILGFVKKDAPTDKYISSKNGFKKLFSLIKKANCKIYLQKIHSTQEDIIELGLFKNKEDKIKELKMAVETVFNVLNSNMPNNLTYAMFSIFKCIEIITYLYVEEKDKKAYWKNTNNKIEDTGFYKYRREENTTDLTHIKNENSKDCELGFTSVENKIRTIMIKKLKLSSEQLHVNIKCIVCIRNHAMHQDKTYDDKEFCKNIITQKINPEKIIDWFEMLKEIIKGISKNPPINI